MDWVALSYKLFTELSLIGDRRESGAVAIIGNIMVLRLFGTFAALRSPSNLLVMNLAVSDLLLMGSLVPELVYNFFSGGPWRFGNMACQIHAFCGTRLALYIYPRT